jgi:hypothetical protein
MDVGITNIEINIFTLKVHHIQYTACISSVSRLKKQVPWLHWNRFSTDAVPQ